MRVRARDRVRDLLRHVPPPRPWSMNAWLDRLERHRGRDIDLIAAPWTDQAVAPEVLAEAIRTEAARVVGVAFMDPMEAPELYFQRGRPGAKPHGRLGWVWHLGGGPYIDLSVLPPLAKPWMDGDEIVAACAEPKEAPMEALP